MEKIKGKASRVALVLSGDSISIGKEEFARLCKPVRMSAHGRIILGEVKSPELCPRIAYALLAAELGWAGKREQLLSGIKEAVFPLPDGKDAYVRFLKSGLGKEEKKRAAETLIERIEELAGREIRADAGAEGRDVFVVAGSGALLVAGRSIPLDKSYNQRKPHMKPEMLPISMSPKLARGMINITGLEKGAIVDPFCGVGGILVEAGMLGFRVVGAEIRDDVAEKCRKNLQHYSIPSEIRCGDGVSLIESIGRGPDAEKRVAVVTEVPFGRNTSPKNLMGLYERFIEAVRKAGVVCAASFPNDESVERIMKRTGILFKRIATIRIHRSLSKRIYILNAK